MEPREPSRVVEAIHDALDRGDPESALASARDALPDAGPEAALLRFLAGVALLELDRPEEASGELRSAVECEPEDPEFLARLALAEFRCLRFDRADRFSRRALASPEELPEAHEVRALVLERRGRFEDADRHLARAHELAPEDFPLPVRMPRDRFEREVVRAGELLPEEFRRHLADVATSVEDLPSDEILRDGEPCLDPELLGLFVGVALTEKSAISPGGELPARILLFQRNLERIASDPRALREEIAVTLYHELGHYLGLDEGQLEELDLA